MATKKILFISYDGMTDPLGQSQVIPYLAGLTKFGYRFTILSCDKPDRYALHKDYVDKLLAPYPIEWVSLPYHKKPPVLSSWYDYRMLCKTAKALHLKDSFDLVHTRVGVPALVGYWLKKNLGIKFLNDIRGFWADERVDGGMWNIKNPVYKLIYQFFRAKEDEFIVNADYNTCLTFAGRKEIHSWKSIPNQPIPIEVIPCSADMDLFNPEKIEPALLKRFREELTIADDDIIISYLGSIGGWYLTEEMIRFCKLLSERIPKARFLFISPHLHQVIVAAAEKYGLAANRLIVKHGKRHEIPALLSLSDYAVFFIKPCYSKISSSPTKHGEIMAMGIPVITNGGVGDVENVVTKYNSGYVVNDFSDESFENIIEKIISGNSFSKTGIRKGAEEFYSLTRAVEKYHTVYEKIFEKRN
jgi:glycosyltransferase involved in cell wall biosynthesis